MQVILQFFKDISPIKLAATAVTIITFLIIFAIFLSKVNDSEMVVLYSDLDIHDSAKIAQELDQQKIKYIATGDGSLIKVHKSVVVNTRLALASAGLPSSGSLVGYEIFDQEDSIGATNFSQNVKLIRALEGELSRTISAFEQISKARVHLVMPQREIFSKEKLSPKASVVIKFKGRKRLGKTEIDAISHLVVTSVPGLEMKNITIVDTQGRALKIGSAEEEDSFAGNKSQEIKSATELRLKTIIEELLGSTIGAGKVKAQVALEMNFDRIVTNSEIYDPDSAVVRSSQTIEEREQTPLGGGSNQDASVANNIPGGGGANGGSSNLASSEKSDQTTNYEISKTIKNHISESGIIKKMSIGVLVDGTYKTNEETEETTYTPRSTDDLDKLTNLIKVAVGFDEDRGDKIEVINMEFASDLQVFDDASWIKEELPQLFQTLILAIVVLLVLITVIRPIALKAFEVRKGNELDTEEVLEDVDEQLSDPASAAKRKKADSGGQVAEGTEDPGEMADDKKPKADPILKANELAAASPQDLVNVLRKWLNEGE